MEKSNVESEVVNLISDQQRIIEISVVVITALGKFVFMDFLNWRLPFILTAILGWVFYIIHRKRKKTGILKYWGFRIDNFKEVSLKVLPFGLVSLIIFLAFGYFQETINLTWHIIPILIFYPIWGTIQQFLMIGLVAGNLQDLKSKKLNKIVIITATATLFALVHYPDYWLILGTFILALFYGYIYLSSRNVYVMGLFHGWLGGLFYYTIVDRDPFLEIFGKFL